MAAFDKQVKAREHKCGVQSIAQSAIFNHPLRNALAALVLGVPFQLAVVHETIMKMRKILSLLQDFLCLVINLLGGTLVVEITAEIAARLGTVRLPIAATHPAPLAATTAGLASASHVVAAFVAFRGHVAMRTLFRSCLNVLEGLSIIACLVQPHLKLLTVDGIVGLLKNAR